MVVLLVCGVRNFFCGLGGLVLFVVWVLFLFLVVFWALFEAGLAHFLCCCKTPSMLL